MLRPPSSKGDALWTRLDTLGFEGIFFSQHHFRAQCRACGAGHIVGILGRAVDVQRVQAVELFAEQVIPILRRAEIA